MSIRLELACNDPDNGVFAGMVYAVQVCDLELRSKALDWGPRLTVGDGYIRIGGMKLRCTGSKDWYGNWCWNAYYCDVPDVERLLNWEKFRKWFDVEQSPTAVYDKYRGGLPLRFIRKPRRTDQ